MANVRISQLPVAPDPIDGSELVPIVQNGQTVQTTVSDIISSPSLTQTFLTVGAQPSLSNSRYIGGGLGIGTSDAGAQGVYSLFLNGTSASLENASTGVIVKSGVNTVVNRTIAVGTAGLSISNGSGVSGNPTLSLTDLALSIATLTGNGMVSLVGGSYFQNVTLTGTANQISIANPNGGSNPTFSIANNPIVPGTEGMVVPSGTTAQRASVPTNGTIRYNTTSSRFEVYQNSSWTSIGTGDGTVTEVFNVANQTSVTNGTTTPTVGLANNPILPGLSAVTLPKGGTSDRTGSPVNGMLRYNTDTATFEGYANSAWGSIVTGSGVTSVGTGTGLLGGPITSTGTISIDDTVVATLTGTQTLTNKTLTTPVIAQIVNTGTLTLPTSTDTLVARATTDTLTNKSISGSTNTLSNIGNGSLTNSSVTYNGVTVALGASGTITASTTAALTVSTGLQLNSGTTFDGSTAKTISIDSTVATLTGSQTLTNKTMSGASNTFSNIGNGSLINSAVTYNGVSVALGSSGTITAANPNALTIGTGLSGTSYDGSSAVTVAITNTGVTAATYGSASAVAVVAVNAQGQITSATTTAISIASSAITDKGLANGLATLDGSGTVPTSQLPAAVLGALKYQGTWNASTNTPTLTSSVGTQGYYYVVDVAGSTNLNGITDWKIGDWAIFNGSIWEKIDNTDAVTSVNGYTGTVVLSYSDVGAPSTSGTNATGTWGISISGNAATATSATTATTATNANNVAVTTGSASTNYLSFVTATTGNLPVLTNSGLTYNSSTNAITGGITGGTF